MMSQIASIPTQPLLDAASSSPISSSTSSAPTRPHTRSIFPPFPRSIPLSSNTFPVVADMSLLHINSASATLAVFNRIMNQHSRAAVSSSSSVTSSVSQSLELDDIARVYISQSRTVEHQFTFYVHCTSSQACCRMRQLTAQTTLTCNDTRERVMIGKVSTIPFRMSTDVVMCHIQSHAPEITSLVLTRVQQYYPSTHYRDHAYFSILVGQLKYLLSIPPLVLLSWFKYNPPVLTVCT